jgi:hypothetical protein
MQGYEFGPIIATNSLRLTAFRGNAPKDINDLGGLEADIERRGD